MKKLIIILFVVLLLLLACTFIYQYMKVSLIKVSSMKVYKPGVPSPTPVKEASSYLTISYNNETYAYDLITVSDSNTVSLIPNFTEKKDSASLQEQHACGALINGGFYDTDYRPLGLFTVGNDTIRNNVNNALINGYIWADDHKITITDSPPDEKTSRFAMQTGPFLIKQGTPLPLKIRNDEPARRVVAVTDTNNRLYFIVIFQNDAVFQGPLLGELPRVLSTLADKEHLSIVDAVNLDGGSASVFRGDITLQELSPVGSIFCVK